MSVVLRVYISDIVANGPREPGVGAELIGSDIYERYKSHLRNADTHKACSSRCAERDEKLHDIKVSKVRTIEITKIGN